MKKVLFAALMTVAAQGVFAQINKGQWLVGGNIGFESAKYGDLDESQRTNFTFSPNAGYFFIDKLAGGLRVDFASQKYKEASEGSNDLLVAPFVRYYFLETAKQVNIFADASYGFGSKKDAPATDGNGQNQFAFSAGPAIFLTPHTAVEFALQYKSKGGDAWGEDRLNSFGINIGFQIHLGGGKK